VSVGGDGSISEVYNGMMARPDGYRLPLSVIPNGSGNTWAYSLGIESPDEALDTLITATVIKTDSVRLLADTENNEEVPIGQEGYKQRRYCLCIANGGDMIDIIPTSIVLKPYFGNASYFIVLFKLLLIDGVQNWRFDVEVDGKKVSDDKQDDCSWVTSSANLNIVKFMGDILTNPGWFANDGLICIHGMETADDGPPTLKTVGALIEKSKKGGLFAYEEKGFSGWKGRKIKVTAKGRVGAGADNSVK